MRNNIIMICALLLVACSTKTEKTETEKTPWPIEPKTTRVEYMLSLESMTNDLTGNPRDVDSDFAKAYAEINNMSEAEVVSSIQETYDAAIEAWHKFVWLCNEGREKEALEFYIENHITVDMAIPHSIMRYTFHDRIIDPMAYEHLEESVADGLMMDLLGFDFTIISGTYMMGAEELYREVMDEICYTLVHMYHYNDRYDDLLHLYDIWLESSGAFEQLDILASVNFSRANIYFYAKEDHATALKYLKESRSNLDEYLKQGGNDEEMKQMLSDVKSIIAIIEKLI
jgi:hypothetical protein